MGVGGGGGSKGYVGPPSLKLFGGVPVPMPMQVSQFLSSEIICLLTFL